MVEHVDQHHERIPEGVDHVGGGNREHHCVVRVSILFDSGSEPAEGGTNS